jgi:prepilin-type N-terminal cleavage/methylation domain-containing protein
MASRGFTIIELMAVLLLMALLAGAVVYTFGPELRSARLADSVSQLAELDAMARRQAATSGRGISIVIKPDAGRAFARDSSGRLSQSVRLHPRVRVDRILTSSGRDTRGDVEVPVTAQGRSGSYALHLSAPRQTPRWLVIGGLGGDITESSDDEQVLRIFSGRGDGAALAGGDDTR